MENKIQHPLPNGIDIEFKHNDFFIQGQILTREDAVSGWLYKVRVNSAVYSVREGEVMAVLKTQPQETKDMVNHPAHYGGENNPFSPRKITRHYKLSWELGSAIKYILRDKDNRIQDLEKAINSIRAEIDFLKEENV
jgi:hypothetical protein